MSERQTAAQQKALGRVFWIGLIAATLSLLFILGPNLPMSIEKRAGPASGDRSLWRAFRWAPGSLGLLETSLWQFM